MRDKTVSRSYAEALFELGERHGQQDAIAAALDALTTALEDEARFRAFVETPRIGSRAKRAALHAALGGRAPALLLNFLNVVLDKRRERLLGAIAREYRELLDERHGRLRVQLTLARRPTAETQRAMTAELSRALGRDVVPQVRIDENILGGVVLRYRDRMLDGSLRRRLLRMRNRLRRAAVPAGG